MRSRIIGLTSATAAFILPIIASAQTPIPATGILNLLGLASRILNSLVALFVLAAVVVFFWGLVRYLASSSGEAKAGGLKQMIYGIIAIFVMVSIWGIIRILQQTVGVDSRQDQALLPSGIQPR